MQITIDIPDGHIIKVLPPQQPSEAAVGSTDGLACDVCGGRKEVREFGKWLVGRRMIMCSPCFEIWYDGGETDLEKLKVKSLAKQANS